jgi:hypothetical protein
VFTPGYKGAGVIRNNASGTNTPSNYWGGGGADAAEASEALEETKKAKGRKGKQVVFQWG